MKTRRGSLEVFHTSCAKEASGAAMTLDRLAAVGATSSAVAESNTASLVADVLSVLRETLPDVSSASQSVWDLGMTSSAAIVMAEALTAPSLALGGCELGPDAAEVVASLLQLCGAREQFSREVKVYLKQLPKSITLHSIVKKLLVETLQLKNDKERNPKIRETQLFQ